MEEKKSKEKMELNKLPSVSRMVFNEVEEELKLIKVDGVPNILRAHYALVKLAWLLVFLCFAGLCVLLIVESFHEYFEYQVATNFKYIGEQEPLFPTITVCNMRQFTTPYARDTFMTPYDLYALLNSTDFGYSGISLYTKYVQIYQTVEALALNTTGAYLSDEQLRATGASIDDMLVDCTYASNKCTSDDFEWIFHPVFLNCYRFNSLKRNATLRRATLPGFRNNRLAIQLYAGETNSSSSPIANYTSTAGFYVFVHNATEYPFNNAPSPYMVTPGIGTLIAVSRTFYEQYEYKYSECTVNNRDELTEPLDVNSGLFEQVVATGYAYSRTTCLQFCVQRLIVQHCNCSLTLIDYRPSSTLCLTSDQLTCANLYYMVCFLLYFSIHICTTTK